MSKAIEHIVAGYSTLKNREALEEIRDHRRRLLMKNRMSAANSGFNLDRIASDLQEEISIVEAALSRFQDRGSNELG
ncbi:hypothetical protein FFI89_007010 [Bradyrhizobium sp. KBS0727]|jgi:hypothetical protein|uniref:hypothetical protein n=1 Tax=unclassified Bradyrhizobium TaxID=2631580 RepID=UPI00110DB1B6|nr:MULTISPECIES: hypothetical protein [unclassified Bradyrhizobium]QDW36913.1 hypothetical protein FFI71_007010 [Bradyrhizobium sp. KBS0725]QDW43513.1 hypothetical protein FFI89_007010 [Bradyrhizobium sp. KBS0727]